MKDRRTQRSNDPLEAAEMYLNAAAERRDYRALALANSDGNLVAQAKSAEQVLGAVILSCSPHDPRSPG